MTLPDIKDGNLTCKKCIHQLFDEQVAKSPDSIALEHGKEKLSYKELNSKANRLANYLIKQGAMEGAIISMCVERSVEMIIGLLAIVKTGASLLPLDPIYPKARLGLILEDAEPVVLITQTSLLEKLPPISGKLLLIENGSLFANEPDVLPVLGRPTNPAYILYTSGSTGKPKGVPIQHHSLVNLINSMTRVLAVTDQDTLLAVTTIAFDIAQMEVYLPLVNGARLIVASQETASDPEMLIEELKRSKPTLFQATPVTYKMLILNAWEGSKDLKLVCGGEAFSKQLARDLLLRCKEVWNCYGPTETTIYSVVKKISEEDNVGEGYVPIGRPIDNTSLFVLNEELLPVPKGEEGELYIGGTGLSSGYLHLPEVTKERFVPNPFSENQEERIYKTGDLVRYVNDDDLTFITRVDFQVKIRGFRIELGEIESAIAGYNGISENVVVAREDHTDDKRLVAYLVKKKDTDIDLSELRHFLQSKLPEYMVPVAYVFLDQFPVTPNGKIDRKALLALDYKVNQPTEKFVAPETEVERKLAELWADILKTGNPGVHDNFFENGGNSLFATILIARIRQYFGILMPLKILFEKQTIANIAPEIEFLIKTRTIPLANQTIIHSQIDSENAPLSAGQKRLWFVENFEPGNLAYTLPFFNIIKGEINPAVLEKSINELIKRHDSLRTIITTSEGMPVQKILRLSSFRLELVHLEQLSEQERNAEVERYADINALHLFDFEKWPLFICKLLKLSTKNYVLLLNFHHIITDGSSIRIIMEELGLIYTALMENKAANLPELPITYADYALWQNDWMKGEDCRQQLDFWVKEMKGAPELMQLPMDFQRPKKQTYDGDEVNFVLDTQLTGQLAMLSRKNGASLFVTLLSIFNSLIARYTSQEEFVIGIPIAGRVYRELELLNGMLINDMPIRVAALENMTFTEMVELCKTKLFQAFDNQELPFDRIVEEMKVTRHANVSPLFQVLFNLINMFDVEINLDGASMEIADRRGKIAQFDLSLNIYESKKTLNCVLEYNTNLFRRDRIERMAGHFQELVKSLIKDPDQKIRRIPILTEKEKNMILKEWNATGAEFPQNKCIHQLFEEQVVRSPLSIAIQDDHQKVSYEELNAKANQLARYLHRSGAVEGSLIGICADRSTDLLVALLAVMKAGCTYIPLDPIYPKERLALILEDGKPALLLTEKKLLENLPETEAKNIFIEEREAYANESVENTKFNVSPETVAYLIYTSGSTGKPKGVQIQHRALVNFITSMAKKPGIMPNDLVLAVTTISFDIAGLELYLPILYGAGIFIATQETSVNPELLIKKIEDCQPTILQATPVTFRMLNASGWKGLKSLRILCGGEALPKELAHDLIRKCSELWNMYGPTETTVWSTVERVALDEGDTTGYVNLGRPIDNTLIYVLNSELQPVPVGYPGELFIGGDGLAKGYFNLPEMTREKFLQDPFSTIPGAHMYRTGDLVQQTDDGKLEFLNRVDSQVKIRGFRIELGEIESALTQYKSVRDNVVIVREDSPGDKRLIAYIIRRDHAETDIPDLRQFLKTKVPDYMVPSAFVFIEQFPLTPNGKIDRKALPAPFEAPDVSDRVFQQAETETEKKLHDIWSGVLNLKQIGVEENFFEIGGHSMIAVTLMIKIEKELGIRLPLATLFDYSNIRDMAEFINNKSESAGWGSLVPIRSKGAKPPLYLVHGAGLNLLLYTTIVSHLDADQPVFGLQAKGLDGIDEPLNTIEGIAAYYNEEILKVDKSGSYALAGFSMGGQIAYEMARQLVLLNHKVSFLGMFDTVSDNVSDRHLPLGQRIMLRIDRLYHQIIWNLVTFFKKPFHEKHAFFAYKLKSLKQRITKDDYKLKPEGVSEGKQSELPKYLHKVHQANWEALDRYILPEYSGKLHLFRALDHNFYIKDPVSYGWAEYAKGGVVIINIPGTHSRIFAPPNDKIFAEALQRSLDEANMR